MLDEIFGPIMPIFTFKGIDTAIEFINKRPKPLAVYFYGLAGTRDSVELMHKTSSGAYMTNDSLMQCISHYQGFGGVGESGSGRYGGYEGFKQFSNPKSMLIKSPVPAMARESLMPPYTEDKLKMTFSVMIKACLYN